MSSHVQVRGVISSLCVYLLMFGHVQAGRGYLLLTGKSGLDKDLLTLKDLCPIL